MVAERCLSASLPVTYLPSHFASTMEAMLQATAADETFVPTRIANVGPGEVYGDVVM